MLSFTNFYTLKTKLSMRNKVPRILKPCTLKIYLSKPKIKKDNQNAALNFCNSHFNIKNSPSQ